ncbi:MAG: AAC(3) family N-acetyltransferase [Chloroflexi bacterium]|nr:AAC(3) family N-acetyltransferase [Chloroflexota bacterium]
MFFVPITAHRTGLVSAISPSAALAAYPRTALSIYPPTMVLTRDRLAADLRRLGISPGDVLMIHSSLRSLGHVVGGAPTVVDALLEVLGPSGTLVGPSFNFESAQDPNFVFDPLNSPSDMGAIADEIRRRAGNLRSRHLTHSISAIGPQAQTIVTAPGKTAWAADSPLGTVFELDGHFLLLGVTYQSFTALHVLEVAFRLRYRIIDTLRRRLRRTDGSLVPFESIVYLRDVGYPGYDFNRLGQAMEDVGLTSVEPVGNAIARLIPAQPMREFAAPRVQRDPDYLLQQGSGVTPLGRGVTLKLPAGVISVVDPSGVFQARGT